MEMLGLRKKLGSSIRKSRVVRGWTQEELARRTLVSPSTIKRMQMGGNQPLFDYLRVLSILNPHLLSRLSDAITFRAEDFALNPLDALYIQAMVRTKKRVRNSDHV